VLEVEILKKLVIDLDGTLTIEPTSDYRQARPNKDLIRVLNSYKARGYYIVIFTARNMRTFDGEIGKINVHTLPIIIDWLKENDVPYDEVIVGKPWCGKDGFYIDDRALRPNEFIEMSESEIISMLSGAKKNGQLF
jgi:capsule biosynthesis phosphatase